MHLTKSLLKIECMFLGSKRLWFKTHLTLRDSNEKMKGKIWPALRYITNFKYAQMQKQCDPMHQAAEGLLVTLNCGYS